MSRGKVSCPNAAGDKNCRLSLTISGMPLHLETKFRRIDLHEIRQNHRGICRLAPALKFF
jgi:hypothetical protein